jgi:glutaredoxin
MRHLSFFLISLSLVLQAGGLAHGEIYKWVDKNSVVHFGDMPPQTTGTSSKVESLPVTPRKDPEPQVIPVKEEKSQVLKRPVKQVPAPEETAPVITEASVEMFATRWCGYCRKAREFFQARGIPFVEYDIEADAAAAQRKQEIDTRPGVPLVVINGKPIHGFAPQAYEQALQARE